MNPFVKLYRIIVENNETIIKKVRRIAEVSRRSVCTGYHCSIPTALCLEASKILYKNLEKGGFDPILVKGEFKLDIPYTSDDYDNDTDYNEFYEALHYWVEIPDIGLIIDITADQFNDEIYEKYPYIVIGSYEEYDRYIKIDYKKI